MRRDAHSETWGNRIEPAQRPENGRFSDDATMPGPYDASRLTHHGNGDEGNDAREGMLDADCALDRACGDLNSCPQEHEPVHAHAYALHGADGKAPTCWVFAESKDAANKGPCPFEYLNAEARCFEDASWIE